MATCRTLRANRILVVVTALLASACAQRPVARSERVERLRQIITLTRDTAPHPGPRGDALPPDRVHEAASATDAESARRAMAKLLDELDDGHAGVRALEGKLAGPEGCIVVVADGSRWLGTYAERMLLSDLLIWCPVPLGMQGRGSPREWMRIERIDGYAPRRNTAAVALLEGPLGTTVEVEGTLLDGTVVRRVLSRGAPDQWCFIDAGEVDPLADHWAAGLDFGDPLPGFVTSEAPVTGPPLVRSERVGPGGRVGYLRLNRLDSTQGCTKSDCESAPCPDRQAIAEAVEPLLECDTIILDISGNGGGTCSHAGEVMRRLLPRSFERVPMVHLEFDGSDPERKRWPVESAERRFGGRLIVLVDEGTGSATEHLAAILKGAPGVTLIGAPTGGYEFSVFKDTFKEDGFVAQFGARGTVWDAPHRSAEGAPIEPDTLVPINRELLSSFGPPVALAQRRLDQLVAAWREAGLRGPAEGVWADLRSLIPWRMALALGVLGRWAVVGASVLLVASVLMIRRIRRRKIRFG